MTDNNASPEPLVPTDGAADGAPRAGAGSFFASTIGKVVIGAVILLLIAGAAAGILLNLPTATEPVSPAPQGAAANPVVATATPSAVVESPTVPPTPEVQDTFSYRNVFKPTISAPATASTTASDTTGSTDSAPPNTLLLTGIETVDGEPQATFVWNGETYKAGEGDQLGDTPWRVVSISGTSVVMQYGDARVTISVGQGITK